MPRSLVRCERGSGETLRDELVTQFQPELEDSRIVSLGNDPWVVAIERVAVATVLDIRFPLRMVPGVEAFRPELQVDPLGEGERLVQGQVPVVAAGADQAVVAEVSPGSRSRCCEARDGKPLNPLQSGGFRLRVGNRSN